MSQPTFDPDDPRAHPDTPMTPDEIRRMLSDPVAVESMLMLGKIPSWNEYVRTGRLVEEFNERLRREFGP